MQTKAHMKWTKVNKQHHCWCHKQMVKEKGSKRTTSANQCHCSPPLHTSHNGRKQCVRSVQNIWTKLVESRNNACNGGQPFLTSATHYTHWAISVAVGMGTNTYTQKQNLKQIYDWINGGIMAGVDGLVPLFLPSTAAWCLYNSHSNSRCFYLNQRPLGYSLVGWDKILMCLWYSLK